MTDRRHHPGQDVPDSLHYQTDRAESRESTAHPSRTSTTVTPTETASRSRMPDRVRPNGRQPNHQTSVSVFERLGSRWGCSGPRAKWLAYHRERGLRGQCMDVIAELGPVKADEWFADVLDALDAGPVLPVEDAIRMAQAADAAEEVAETAYLLDPSPEHHKALLLATRRQGSTSRQLARSLEADRA